MSISHKLADRGFKTSVRRSIPFFNFYRSVAPTEAENHLTEDSFKPLRLQNQEQTISLSNWEQAKTLDQALQADPELPLDALGALEPEQQAKTLNSLKDMSPQRKAENLRRMAEHTIVPGDWQGQFAQLQLGDKVRLLDERKLGLTGRIPDLQELESLSAQAEDSGLDFEYLSDGCHSRGHVKCNILRENAINSGKLFVEGDLGPGRSTLVEVNGVYHEVPQRWKFHTAPYTMVETEKGQIEARVWDPTVAKVRGESEWLTPKQWLDSITNDKAVDLVLHDDTKYLPQEEGASFEETLVRARKDVKDRAEDAKHERFKREVIKPMQDMFRKL